MKSPPRAARVEPLEPRRLMASSVERVSVANDGSQADAHSESPAMSADGRYVAFLSTADNLVAGDLPGRLGVFVRDRTAGTTRRVSIAIGGGQPTGNCFDPAISADGRYVAYSSGAPDIVAGDVNARSDVFVFDTVNGTTRLVSQTALGGPADYNSYSPSLSADGRYVAFLSDADNLVDNDTNVSSDVFVFDTVSGSTVRASTAGGVEGNASSYTPAISGDGRYVAFLSDATNLVPADNNNAADVFVFDRIGGGVQRASISSAGIAGNGPCGKLAISGDGRYVAFESAATNLVTGDSNGATDIFVRDRVALTTTRVSLTTDGQQRSGPSTSPAITSDGRYVAYVADSGLPAGRTDIFLRDRTLGLTRRVSSGPLDITPDDSADYPALSSDARYVGFFSNAANLVPSDNNGVGDVFVKDLLSAPYAEVVGVASGSPAASAANGTDFGAADVAGQVVVHKFTLRNSGSEPLRLTGAKPVTATGGLDFAVAAQPAVSVLAPGESTTFDIAFDPSAIAVRQAFVSIASNAANGLAYSFAVGGVGVDRSNIARLAVTSGGVALSSDAGATFSMGTYALNDLAPIYDFVVTNTSDQTLTLDALVLENNAAVEITSTLADSVLAPAGTTTFSLRVLTNVAVNAGARVRLTGTSFNTQSAVFNVSAVVSGPVAPPVVTPPVVTPVTPPVEPPVVPPVVTPPVVPPVTPPQSQPAVPVATVLLAGAPVSSGQAIGYGSVVQGESGPTKVFVIRNDGSAVLNLVSPTIPAGFVLSSPPLTTLAPGQSTSFAVSMDTSLPSTPAGRLALVTNEEKPDPFSLDLSGAITPAPKVGLTVESVRFAKAPPAMIVGGSKSARGAVSVMLANHTGAPLTGTYRITVYASRTTTGAPPSATTDPVLATFLTTLKLKTGATKAIKANLTFPVPPTDATYQVVGVVTGASADRFHGYLPAATGVVIHQPLAKLSPGPVPSGKAKPAKLGRVATASATLANSGNAAPGPLAGEVYLSTDGTLAPGSAFLLAQVGGLKLSAKPGKTGKLSFGLALPQALPAGFAPGVYRFVIKFASGAGVDSSAATQVQAGTLRIG